MRKIVLTFFSLLLFVTSPLKAADLTTSFVYLKNIDPTILQDIRYATHHNFIGHPIAGYEAAECILTKPAALALAEVQKELRQSGLSLKVYDCYRPQKAVNEFITWSTQPELQQMKAEFYPRVDKADFFTLGYVARKSGHTRGSTVDLTIVPFPAPHQKAYSTKQKLTACFAPYLERFADNTIDMGTGFDCLDTQAHNENTDINTVAWHNRMILKTVMEKHGFNPYEKEWWHFTLKNEPYPDTYFNFPVTKNIS